MAKYVVPVEVKKLLRQRYPADVAKEYIKALQETGQLPQGVAGPATRVQTAEEAYRELNKNPIEEFQLEDQDLADRLELFKEIGTPQERTIDRNKVYQSISSRLLGLPGVDPSDQLQQSAQALTDYLVQNGRLPEVTGAAAQIAPIITGELQRGDYYMDPTIDTSGDVSRIEELIRSRGAEIDQEKAVQEMMGQVQGDLISSRAQFLAGEQQRAGGQLAEDADRIMEQANARGALYSGDPADLIGARAVDIQGQLDAVRAQLEAEDNDFYFNIAYQNQFRKSLQGLSDYRSAIDTERSRISSGQQNRFTSAQGNLDRLYQEDRANQNYLNSFQAEQNRLKRENQTNNRGRNAGIGGVVGAVAGGLLGAKFGGGQGAMLGANLGGGLGAGVGGSIG